MSRGELAAGDDMRSETVAAAERGVTELEGIGELWHRSWLILDLAIFRLERGELAAAEELCRRATRLKSILGDRLGLAYAFELFSWVGAARGDMRRSALLIGAADRLWQSTRAAMLAINRADHDRTVAAVEARLGRAAYASACRDGTEMPLDDAVAFAIGSALPAAAPKPATPREQPTSLTAREMEISRLIGEGMQTKQIAAQLFISERTVETHVTNIMNKLGLASRLQLARWVASLEEVPV